MAEGFLKSFDPSLEVESAGTSPAGQVHPFAVKVMSEAGIDISRARPKSVDRFLDKSFDYVITVCDHARETCPVFTGEVKNNLHLGFKDPLEASGTEEQILSEFRRIRDGIKEAFERFYMNSLARST
jgi:arsenate reductase (thioredoxin)